MSAGSGHSGMSGLSGLSGQSGMSAGSGHSGMSGLSGLSGMSGMSAGSGHSGMSGMSGMSGNELAPEYDGDEVPEFIDDVEMGGQSSGQTGNEMDYADAQSAMSRTSEVTSDSFA